MIVFYPRDIGMWRKDFCFNNNIFLTPKEKTDHKFFHDRKELIVFLKEHGIRLDDANNPLEFIGPHNNERLGPDTYTVKQWSVIGWIKDNYA